jgi:hypothetical protein
MTTSIVHNTILNHTQNVFDGADEDEIARLSGALDVINDWQDYIKYSYNAETGQEINPTLNVVGHMMRALNETNNEYSHRK